MKGFIKKLLPAILLVGGLIYGLIHFEIIDLEKEEYLAPMKSEEELRAVLEDQGISPENFEPQAFDADA